MILRNKKKNKDLKIFLKVSKNKMFYKTLL